MKIEGGFMNMEGEHISFSTYIYLNAHQKVAKTFFSNITRLVVSTGLTLHDILAPSISIAPSTQPTLKTLV